MPEERRRYKNPPIEEALCEFRFAPGQEWDLTLPGKLHTAIQLEYPGKPRQQNVVEAILSSEPGQPTKMEMREGPTRVHLLTANGTRIVGIGQDVLSIHILRPYQDPQNPDNSGWAEFRPRIVKALESYWKVSKPKGILRIDIRYINKIVIPEKKATIEEYFNWQAPSRKGIPKNVKRFINRFEYQYEDDVLLRLTHASADRPSAESAAFILDLEVVWKTENAVDKATAIGKLEDLRAKERTAFEAIITDKTRSLFDE